MNKEGAKNKILNIVNSRPTYYVLINPDEHTAQRIGEIIESYAREQAVDFLKWILGKNQIMLIGRTSDKTLNVVGIKELYDEWKSIQEDK